MSSSEAYLDELLEAMSQKEENAQSGSSTIKEEPAELTKSEPELEEEDLFAEPEAEPEEEELPAETGMEPEEEDLFAKPEAELDVEELLAETGMEPEEEDLFAEPEAEPDVEELLAETGMEPEEEDLFAEPEAELDVEELLAETESEPLLAEPVILSEAEESSPEPMQEEVTVKEDDDTQSENLSADEVKYMTEEEIQQLLEWSNREEEDNAGEQEMTDDDLDQLLKNMEGEDANLAEINDLLYKAENNQPVNPEGEEAAASSGLENEGPKKGKGKAKKERKGLFGRKKKGLTGEEETAAPKEGQMTDEGANQIPEEAGTIDDQQSSEDIFTFGTDAGQEEAEFDGITDNKKNEEKKSGFFSRIMNFLLEDDEDSDQEGAKDETEQLKTTTDENQEVLKQLKKEDQEGKKKKKRKGKEAVGEEAENDDEDAEETGKEKKKKVKKEKKEKPPKPVDDTPQPKLSKKKVRSTALLAFTILAAILVCCLFIPELLQLSDARSAYYDGDYETCYRTLYGKRLSESDRRMFEQSQMMLTIDRNLEAYENYVAVGDELHALDTLLQAVQKQEKLLIEAEKYGLAAEAEAAYQRVLTTLAEKYQLTEADAIEINAYEQDAVYTLRVKSIVEGTEFVLPAYLQQGAAVNMEQQESVPEESVEDVLSAEEELPDTEYEEGILEP